MSKFTFTLIKILVMIYDRVSRIKLIFSAQALGAFMIVQE